jgi:hypothetical protein
MLNPTQQPEEPVMSATHLFAPARELAHRSAHGVDVTMMWDPLTNAVSVIVVDNVAADAFEVEVGDANPMHVFDHPFVYASRAMAA